MKQLILAVAIALLCATTGASAGKIYKWTDSEGNVHYGERPPSSQTQEIKVHKAPPGAATTSPGNTLQDTNKLLETLDKERQIKAEAQAKAEKEQQVRAANCSRARRLEANYRIGGRIYEVDEQGERHYLSDADIQQRLEAARKEVEKWCP